MKEVKKALIVFVRHPEKGKVKTRLAATLGDETALRIYERLLAHTKMITGQSSADKFIFYAGEIMHNDVWEEENYYKLKQKGADLGERMETAFKAVFSKGYEQALIIGSDCPELMFHHLEEAFSKLDKEDTVIGPAVDGGYYLLGMKKLYPPLFRNKQWSTTTVFADTLNTLRELNLTVAVLPLLNDVDEEKDVPLSWLDKG